MAIVATTRPNSTRRKNVAGIAELLFLLLVGPHPHSLSLGGAALPRFPPAGHPNAVAALGTPVPRSGRGRYCCSRGPISFIVLDPTSSAGRLRAVARSRSAGRLRRTTFQRATPVTRSGCRRYP